MSDLDWEEREVIEQAIDFLVDKQGDLWGRYYGEWYSRDTMLSWEESPEHSSHVKEYAEYQKQIDTLKGLLP